jgi:hypothetical protein
MTQQHLGDLAMQMVGEDAHHISLGTHFAKFEDLRVSSLISKLASADADHPVISSKTDGILKQILNYTGAEIKPPDGSMAKPKAWARLTEKVSVHVAQILLMVEDLAPFGFPAKHAYLLIVFSDGHIDRCDLMPKKETAHAELRGFLPGVDVPGKVRYNPWRNDQRAKKAHVMDLYIFIKAQPSQFAVERMKQHLQDHEYKTFNLESNNCQDFAHSVIACLAKVKEKDNVEFNQSSLEVLESLNMRHKGKTQEKHSCWSWLCCR